MADGPFRPREPEDDPRPPGQRADRPSGLQRRALRPSAGSPSLVSSSVPWIVGVLVVVIVAYITLNTIATDAPGSRGVPAGEPLPPFAAPLVIGGPEGDAQVDPDRACEVRGPRILNSCALREGGPVALAFLATRSERCDEQVDVLDRLRERFPDIRFAAVAVRGERAELARVVRRRGWELPVAWDRDGAVANLYAVAICPTITLAGSDGRVVETTFGLQSEAALAERLEALR